MIAPVLESHRPNANPEDILFDSLETLYEYQPITLTSPGSTWTYQHSSKGVTTSITLQTPDPEAANWALHASSIWVGSTQLASMLEHLRLNEHLRRGGDNVDKPGRKLTVLELGAGAGLPSILIAKLYPDICVTVTDYPDKQLIHTLAQNVVQNDVQGNCRAMAYAWGTNPSPLFSHTQGSPEQESIGQGFDVIIAADTLWNPELHGIFIDALQKTLLKDPEARIYLVVGLHTGRYTIDAFLRALPPAGFRVTEILEREASTGDYCNSGSTRNWDVTRAELEEEKDRRKWVIWIELCWQQSRLSRLTSSL